MFSQRGEVCNLVPGNQIASLREKQRKVIDSVIKAKIMGLSTPGGQTNGQVSFSIKLLLKLIWLKVSSAFNLGQRQQWNFPSLSCGA